MKILNLIKIILLSTILLPLIASAGFMDNMKEKKRLNNLRNDCEAKNEKACYSLAKEISENPSPETQKESMERLTYCCKFGGTSCCSELVKKGEYKTALQGFSSLGSNENKRLFLEDACFKVEVLDACEKMCQVNYYEFPENIHSGSCMKGAEIEGKNNPSNEPTEKQVSWWYWACRANNLEGCTNEGLYNSKSRSWDLDSLKKGCAQANPRGCSVLGFKVRENGDIKEAEKYYNMACAGNYEDSCETLEAIRKEIAEINNKKVAQMDQNKKSCEGGVSGGCYQMGEYFYELGTFKVATDYYIKACNGGYARGCYLAGFVNQNNLNKPADAKKYYLLGCNLKDSNACNALGAMESNKGNKAEASKYYAMACDAGNTSGCNNLASVQIDRNNITDARKYLNEACNAGSNAACQKLTALTRQGL